MANISYLSDSDLNAIYKRQYYKLFQNIFSTYGNLWGMIPKSYGRGGDEINAAIQNTFGGGVSASATAALPRANSEGYLEPTMSWKRVYANIQIDGLTMEAARKSEHAFLKYADRATVNKMQSFMRYLGGNCLFNDGTGALGQFSGNAGGSAAAPTLTILNGISDTYQYRKGFFEKGDSVTVNSLTSVFEITAVNHDTRVITLSRISGSDNLTSIGAGTHTVYMEKAKDAEPYGLLGIINNSTHYGVSQEYRYQPFELASGGANLEDEMVIEMGEKFEEDTDEYPDFIVMPPHHYTRFLQLQEDKKRLVEIVSAPGGRSNVGTAEAVAKASYSAAGVRMGNKKVMILKSKYLKPGLIVGGLKRSLEVLGVGQEPGFKPRADGQIFSRVDSETDAYGAMASFYGEIFINPFHVCAITGLPTSY